MADVPHEDPELAAWTAEVRPLLTLVAGLAGGIDRALRAGDCARAAEAAEVFLTEVNRGRPWALADECPHPDVAAELRAGLAVVRNAALLVRRIADMTVASAEELVISCSALLEQGRHHLQHVEHLAEQRGCA
jgi:hypothetical protein